MKKNLLDRLPVDFVENLKLYRFGVFDKSSFDLVELKENEDYPDHYHNNSEAKFYFIFGNGLINLDGKKYSYKKGDSFLIKKGIKHGFKPETETLFLSIQTPPIKDIHSKNEDIHF